MRSSTQRLAGFAALVVAGGVGGVRKRRLLLLLAAAFLPVFAAERRSWSRGPTRTCDRPQLRHRGYGYSQGGPSTDPSLPIEDAHLKIHTAAFGYARSVNLWGCPESWTSSHRIRTFTDPRWFLHRERDITGLNDPRVRLSINFYGAPALAMPEFAKTKQDFVVGASVQVTAPVGQYDPSKAVNGLQPLGDRRTSASRNRSVR